MVPCSALVCPSCCFDLPIIYFVQHLLQLYQPDIVSKGETNDIHLKSRLDSYCNLQTYTPRIHRTKETQKQGFVRSQIHQPEWSFPIHGQRGR